MNFLSFDSSSGAITGVGSTPDGTIPDGHIKCTQAQYENPQAWQVVNGAVVAAPAPTAAQLLADAQAAQTATLTSGYQSAIYADIQYATSGGVTQTFQSDAGSVNILSQQLNVYVTAGAPLPAGYAWTSVDNTQVPFTVADLKGLAAAIGARGAEAFFHLQTQKAAVRAATTINKVQSITW